MATTTAPPVSGTGKTDRNRDHVALGIGIEFAAFSQDAIYQAKRFPLDSVGCALGGYQQHDVAIALEGLTEVGGPGWATLIGTGKQVDSVTASLANALMIRSMDYNDIYGKQDRFASIGHLSGRDGPCSALAATASR